MGISEEIIKKSCPSGLTGRKVQKWLSTTENARRAEQSFPEVPTRGIVRNVGKSVKKSQQKSTASAKRLGNQGKSAKDTNANAAEKNTFLQAACKNTARNALKSLTGNLTIDKAQNITTLG